jgi:drug/metabolite transporter (DMT)-like permease
MTGILLGLFAAFCYALHDQLARLYAERIGPFRAALGVMLLGGALITAYVLWNGTVWSADPKGVFIALIMGVAYALGVGGIFKAFSLGPVSVVAPLTAGYPVLVVLWGLAGGLAPTPLQWIAVAAVVAGAAVIGRTGEADGGINAVLPGKLGALFFWCLVSVLGFAASVVFGQWAGPIVGAVEATWISRFTASLAMLPFVFSEKKPLASARPLWWAVLIMAALDVAGVTAINYSGNVEGAELAAMGISAYAAMGALLAAIILKERISMGQWIGIAMIAAGVAILGAPQ